ncbi:hypothetical protein [Pandoravirus japonicus]|uniref:Uncharacterized protein n=1 Tax=Pandoravirus japonicus TaxID=2823154 RepID=A0A811BPL1_9VIRU|nr:hypothetical protein [Pandoravirus japonicus]
MLKRRLDILPVSDDDLHGVCKRARPADAAQPDRTSSDVPYEAAADNGDGQGLDDETSERRRNFIARTAALNDRDSLRLLLDDAHDRHIKSALYRIIDDAAAVECVCEVLAETGRRLTLAAKVIYRAASRLHGDTVLALVARAGSRRRRASVVGALARLVEDDEAEPIACLFGACAASGSRVSEAWCRRWARDALCAAVRSGRPASAEALVHECGIDDMARLLDRFVADNDGDSAAGLLDACDGIVPHSVWADWTAGALCRAAMGDKVATIESLLDMCEPAVVREALLCCADERHRSETFEALWEHADACAHDFVQRLPRGVGRDLMHDLIDEGSGCEGYCKAGADDQDFADTDDSDDDDGDDRRGTVSIAEK